MSIIPGNRNHLNNIKGVSQIMQASSDLLAQIGRPFPSGVPIYNTDTRKLAISDGISIPSALEDHQHAAYAPRVHSHMFGTNIPWYVSNPKLWYTDDLKNHPELIPLDGSELTDEEATELSKIYPGSKILTEKVNNLTKSGYENNFMTATVDTSKGYYFGSNLFNDPLDLTNFQKTTDQWLTGDTELESEHTVTISFKGGHSYRITSYWLMPAAGLANTVYTKRPTPKSWVLEGSVNGSDYVTIHSVNNYNDWTPLTYQVFETTGTESYSYLRLRITAWNAGDAVSEDTTVTTSLYSGLRRFYVFGRKPNTFNLPVLKSPSDEFTWVVPRSSLNTGLKHEDVGDIGQTASMTEILPK